jgi:F-type H+-transporting ATPase subunit b
MADDWKKADQIYYGPERDKENFPHPVQRDQNPPTRLGFLPASWFDFFYDKTGVTGPYVLGFGALTYMFSKEIIVVEHTFLELLSLGLVMMYVSKRYGQKIGAALDKKNEEYIAKHWEEPLKELKSSCQETIDWVDKEVWRQPGQKHLFEAKKESVDLQLEAVYRQRLTQVHQAVKKRLDYQLDVENAERRYQQKHMVDWIVRNVKSSITPQQEKAVMSKCFQDLKALAAKA